MARTPYGLNQYATFLCKSYNGDNYTGKVYWTGAANTQTWTLAQDGLKISYESEKTQDKNSPILASKCTLNLLVTDGVQQLFLSNLRANYQEKDVWITITHNNGTKLLWCGYVILDLESQEDVSLPNETTLVAVDGIATLKEVPFLREYTVGTTDAPTFPYTAADTFYGAGWQRLIGNSTSWLKLLCDATGQLLATDSTSATLADYEIQTAFNWWNEDMDASPDVANDPLKEMRINIRELYEKDETNQITPPSAYEVIKLICKTFNMRFFYWQHDFYFVGIGEYNTDEVGLEPYTSPVNIPTRTYYYTGSSKNSNNFIGNNNFSLYFNRIDTVSKFGLQKLSGTVYQALPAIKKVDIFYKEQAGMNYFNGYPLFITHNVLQTPTAWPTDGVRYEYTQQSESNGQLNIMSFTNADELAGFIVRIYGQFSNSSNADLYMETAWSMRAKPSTSNWGDTDNYVAYKYQAATYAEIRWRAIGSGTGSQFPLINNEEYIRNYVYIPANCTNAILSIWDSSTSSTTNTTGNLFPVDSSFTGDWDFQFWTFTEFDSDLSFPMSASLSFNNAQYSHGRIIQSNSLSYGTTFDGTSPIVKAQKPPYYAFDYTDAIDANGNFMSRFIPVKTNSQTNGSTGQRIQVNQNSSDTFTYEIGEVYFGDGAGANTTSTIQVWNGSAWQFVDELGKWGLATHTYDSASTSWTWSVTYDKKFQDLLGLEILNNQTTSILTLNGTTVLSSIDKTYSGSTQIKYMNPVSRLQDKDGKKYMMMRTTFNLLKDEVEGEWVQMLRATPTTNTNTQNWDGSFPDEPPANL